MRRARQKKKANSGSISVTVGEDDGTQVERDTVKKVKKTAPAGKKAGLDSAVLKNSLKEFTMKAIQTGVPAILEEFNQIKAQTQAIGDKPKTAFDAHVDKNRYKDVFCIDNSRVQLTFPPGSDDYIHANWVNGSDGTKKFICTQGPKENTIEDFWRMVWQEKCKSIVMLCNEVECGKKKCEKYWPDSCNPTMTLPCKLTIKYLKIVEAEPGLFITKLELTGEDGTTHSVEHLHWRDWPDRGVPPVSLMIYRLMVRFNKLLPSIIHCSAGIGRTGTVVGIELLFSKLEKGEKCDGYLNTIVRELREARHGSVQTDVQYAFMHRVLMCLAENLKAVTPAVTEQFSADYDKMIKAKGAG